MTRKELPPRGKFDLFLTDLILRRVLKKVNKEKPNSGIPKYTRGLKDIFLDLVSRNDLSLDTEYPILSLKPESRRRKSSVIEGAMMEGIETSINK